MALISERTQDSARDGWGNGYKWRALTPSQGVAIRDALATGVRAKELARAYDVSVRTIYRSIERARCRACVVEVDGWRAEFSLTDDGPVRMTAWVPA
jgi:DNA invertase Pin-like site-specific DNA recombinase